MLSIPPPPSPLLLTPLPLHRSICHTHSPLRLKSKGAVSGTGEVLRAVTLTEEERGEVGDALLAELTGAGIVL